MAEALKNIYNESFISNYLSTLKSCGLYPKQDCRDVFVSKNWKEAELKGRMSILRDFTSDLLPKSWDARFKKLRRIIQILQKSGVRNQNLEYIFLADIVSEGAEEDFYKAIPEIEFMTQFVSFEFAGRKLIKDSTDVMMDQMLRWALHSEENVRRYASEGCRPRLPWGLQLKKFIEQPEPIVPILEILKSDPSLYVRKSVANNLNDISKSHPDLVLKICRSWVGNSNETDWIVKHALRTLLKSGNKEALSIVGLDNEVRYELRNLKLDKEMVHLNESINISFDLMNNDTEEAAFRIEYYIYFLKNKGLHNKKIFKISEKRMREYEQITISKKHEFRQMTTRLHYEGIHYISLVINGNESQKVQFKLKY